MKKKKVCIISPAVYPLLKNSKTIQSAGGAEAQLLTLGINLCKNGFDVHYVVDDFGQPFVETLGSVTTHKVPLRYLGGGNYHLLPAWIRFLLVLKRIDADVYIIKMPRNLLLPLGFFSFLFGKRLILIGQTDRDVEPDIIKKKENILSYLFFRAGLSCVDLIVAQSEKQRSGFAQAYGKKTIVINSFLTLTEAEGKTDKGYVLWVGNDSSNKQPLFFVELASQLPHHKFKMIMSSTSIRNTNKIKNRAGKVPNLEFLGFVPFHEIQKYFQKASLLVCTSKREGFPNIFLQSWQYETPVVSLSVNPDNVIERFELGKVSGTFDRLCEEVDQLMRNEPERHRMGGNGKKYVNQNHAVEIVLQQYLSVFDELRV